MAARTFLVDGEAISNEEHYSSEDEDDEASSGEMEYRHAGRDSEQCYEQGGQYEEEQCYEEQVDHEGEGELDALAEDSVPVMPSGFYADVDDFLNRPPPAISLKGSSTKGKKKKISGEVRGKKSGGKSLPVIDDIPKMNVQCKVSTRRTGPGSKKSAHKVLDERLLQQAFEYSSKVQQEAMVEEVYEASLSMQPQKSNSAPLLRPQQQEQWESAAGSKVRGGRSDRKPFSAGDDMQQDATLCSNKQRTGVAEGRRGKPANGVVRRLRSKTQTSVNHEGKAARPKAKKGGFDTSTDTESATSTRNITDFQALVSNFEQGTHLQQLREELEQSKASMAQSRRAMQDISKEMAGKLRI